MFDGMIRNSVSAMNRRTALGFGASGLALAASGPGLSGNVANAAENRLDLTDPKDNIHAFAKIWATLADEPAYGAFQGVFYATLPEQRAIPLFGHVGFGCLQMKLLDDGRAKYRGNEASFYTDLMTGEIIDNWTNPWTDETVKVIPYINDHSRATMQLAYPRRVLLTTAYGWHYNVGEATDQAVQEQMAGEVNDEEDMVPFVLPWEQVGDQYLLGWDFALEVPNPVTPEGWPKASTGSILNTSEHFSFFVPVNDLHDPDKPFARFMAGFVRQMPWLPWMRMGQSGINGLMYLRAHSYKITGTMDDIPRPLLARLERDYPHLLETPKDWEPGPVSSTWDYYTKVVPPETSG